MPFESFCGGPFWNSSVTWDTPHPDFTPCFHRTALSWAPFAVLLVALPFEVSAFLGSKARRVPWSALNLAKLLLSAGLVGLAAAELVYLLAAGEAAPRDADYLAAAIFMAGYALSLALQLASLHYGLRTSAAQFAFYTASVICLSVTLRSLVQDEEYQGGSWRPTDTTTASIFFGIQLGLCCLMFLLNFVADAAPSEPDPVLSGMDKPCPRHAASFISRLFFSWETPLVWKGFRKPLDRDDLWDVDRLIASEHVVPLFDAHLKRAKDKAAAQGRPVSLSGPMLYTFGAPFFAAVALKVVSDLFSIASPQIMSLIIGYVTAYSEGSDEAEEEWKGLLYAITLLAVTFAQSIFLAQSSRLLYQVAMQLKTSLTSVVYRKSLVLSSTARADTTQGEIVNLMAVDIQRFMDVLPLLPVLWSGPITIALCAYFMYQELGLAMLAGIAILIIAIPLNIVAGAVSKKYQVQQMGNKDQRVKLMNEILNGMKVLKLYAWEDSFVAQVLGIRDTEIAVLKKNAWLTALMTFVWNNVPLLVALASFVTFMFTGEDRVLTADIAFVTISYINIMKLPMTFLPYIVVGIVQVRVAISRLNRFVNFEDMSSSLVNRVSSDPSTPVSIRKADFYWGPSKTLHEIDFSVPKGSLTAVVGSVGSGKSSLLSALLGEMEMSQGGSITTEGQLAYVPQQAWMMNATLEENILFGKKKQQSRYEKILDSCALRTDLDVLPGGDQTEIGEKGINLSGGQKQRVSLARATYNDADVYLLDDPLSAVDSHVGKHLFTHVIGSEEGLLRKKTRVLVTHSITFLPQVDNIIMMRDGRIIEQGSYAELMSNPGGALAQFLAEYASQHVNGEESDEPGDDKEESEDPQRRLLERHLSQASTATSQSEVDVQSVAGAKLIQSENAETGKVKRSVYYYYMRNIGFLGCMTALTMQVLYQAALLGTNYWISVWTEGELGDPEDEHYRNIYLGVYGGLGAVQSLALLALSIIVSVTTLNASKRMHRNMLGHVVRSPMHFFDTTPMGRIVNRFAKDVDICDNTLPMNIQQTMNSFFNLIGTAILIIIVLPIFVVIIVPVGILFAVLQTIFVSSSRQLKRMDAITRSPVFSHFGETLQGVSTIRAFDRQADFIKQSERLVDVNQSCYYPAIIANRWIQVRLDALGNLLTFSAALFTIFRPDTVAPSEVGLIISYTLNITLVFAWLVRMSTELETNTVAVERIQEYTNKLEQEAATGNDNHSDEMLSQWPSRGEIKFNEFGLRYRAGLDLVLSGVDFKVDGGQTVGIVGRTGAGKSSLTVALFRIVEAAEGSIAIDDIDIASLGLHDLRQRLTIIPQEPVLFSGTLRINLDPFSAYSDEQVWRCLEQAHLKPFVSALPDGLGHEISEGGENVSVGQRQLLCLARALLRKTKVLILDEATAAVDLETDDMIQQTIRREFTDCTILTIAHRLNTIVDYDRVLVLDKGRVVEFESPTALLSNENSYFYAMARDAGLTNRDIDNDK